MGHESRLMSDKLHKVFMISNTLIYMLCKPLLRVLAVPYEAIVPEHTQYALFQLYCDLRANPIKDRHWLEVHSKRLKPQTFPGWIALTSALLYISAASAGLFCVLLSIASCTLYVLVFMMASAGVVAGVITGLLAFSFFGLACIASFAATSAGIGYTSIATAQAVLRFLSTHLLPRPQDPFEIPELNLRPVATPRAPVQPDPVPAISPASSRVSLPSPSTSGSVSVAQVYTPDALDPIVEDAQLEAAVQEQIADAQAVVEIAKENGEIAALDAVPPVQPPSADNSLRSVHCHTHAKANGTQGVSKSSKQHKMHSSSNGTGISAKAGS